MHLPASKNLLRRLAVGTHNGREYETAANANLRVVKNGKTKESVGRVEFYEHASETEVEEYSLEFHGKYQPSSFDANGVLHFPKDGVWAPETKKFLSSVEIRSIKFDFANPVENWTFCQITIRHDNRDDARMSKAFFAAMTDAGKWMQERSERESLSLYLTESLRLIDEEEETINDDELLDAATESPSNTNEYFPCFDESTPPALDRLHVANGMFLWTAKGVVWSGSSALTAAYAAYFCVVLAVVDRALSVKQYVCWLWLIF